MPYIFGGNERWGEMLNPSFEIDNRAFAFGV
jgi:hypothetical protein